MIGKHDSYRAAAAAAASWPSMRTLRGKLVIVMTGGSFLSTPGNRILREYVEARRNLAVAFVAPETDNAAQVTGTPDKFDAELAKSIVFFNLPARAADLGPLIRSMGCVSRTWGISEDNATYLSLIGRGVNFIALDRYAEKGFNDGRMQGVLVCGAVGRTN